MRTGRPATACTKARVKVATPLDRKSTRLNSSHLVISYAVFCLKKKITYTHEMEEAGSREIEFCHALGQRPGGNLFLRGPVDFAYGVTAFHTSLVYLHCDPSRQV